MVRRAFLKMAGVPAVWWQVRGIVRGGGVGRVVFCRVPPGWKVWLPFLLGLPVPVCEASERQELVLCGTDATLVIDRAGWRRFA
jgi:hypothetical protein